MPLDIDPLGLDGIGWAVGEILEDGGFVIDPMQRGGVVWGELAQMEAGGFEQVEYHFI